MNKQARQILEFITLLDKVAGRIAIPSGVMKDVKIPFVPSLKSKAPAPPLPPVKSADSEQRL